MREIEGNCADLLVIFGRTEETGDAAVGEDQQAWFRDMWEGKKEEELHESVEEPLEEPADAAIENNNNNDDDDFGDDFDEFAEEGGDDDDFGDFDEADADDGIVEGESQEPQPQSQPTSSSLSGLVSSQQNQHFPLDPTLHHNGKLTALSPPNSPLFPSPSTSPPPT